jgi:HJR/Mrr/RecB family endonuclease
MAIPVRFVHRQQLGCSAIFAVALLACIAAAYWPWAVPLSAVFIGARILMHRRRRAGLLAAGKTLTGLYALAPEHFEQYIGIMLERLGWEKVRWIGHPGDLGADVTAIDPQGRKCVVQAKRYAPTSTVGSPVVQALLGSQLIYHADRSVLVTTGRFTPAAMDLAAAMDVELIDGERLIVLAQRSEKVSGNA